MVSKMVVQKQIADLKKIQQKSLNEEFVSELGTARRRIDELEYRIKLLERK